MCNPNPKPATSDPFAYPLLALRNSIPFGIWTSRLVSLPPATSSLKMAFSSVSTHVPARAAPAVGRSAGQLRPRGLRLAASSTSGNPMSASPMLRRLAVVASVGEKAERDNLGEGLPRRALLAGLGGLGLSLAAPEAAVAVRPGSLSYPNVLCTSYRNNESKRTNA